VRLITGLLNRFAAVTISVIEVRPGRWAYMIDGKFSSGQYDATWGLITYVTAEDATAHARSAGDE
jgi:hypothetical protein